MQHALIVEDVPETGEWLCNILPQAFGDIHITLASTCQQARQTIEAAAINIALLDINLPDGSGIDLVPCIRQRYPDAYIVITTIFDDEEHILRALKAGTHGYLLKDLPDRLFIQKLRGILNGDPPISPSISRRILQYFATERMTEAAQREDATPYARTTPEAFSLSPREQEILTLVAKGLNRPEISSLLGLSTNTVARYIRDVYQKLNISSRAEAAVEACRRGLVSTELH